MARVPKKRVESKAGPRHKVELRVPDIGDDAQRAQRLSEMFAIWARFLRGAPTLGLVEDEPAARQVIIDKVRAHWILMAGLDGKSAKDHYPQVRRWLVVACEEVLLEHPLEGTNVTLHARAAIGKLEPYLSIDEMKLARACLAQFAAVIIAKSTKKGITKAIEALFKAMEMPIKYDNYQAAIRNTKRSRRKA